MALSFAFGPSTTPCLLPNKNDIHLSLLYHINESMIVAHIALQTTPFRLLVKSQRFSNKVSSRFHHCILTLAAKKWGFGL